jgi:hypothetical protein
MAFGAVAFAEGVTARWNGRSLGAHGACSADVGSIHMKTVDPKQQ